MGTPLTDLLQTPAALGTVTTGIQKAVDRSLASHPMRHVTRDEIRRRFGICVKWFKAMRLDYKFSIDRAVAQLGAALRAELDGRSFDPHTRALWRPEEERPSGLVGPDGSPLGI